MSPTGKQLQCIGTLTLNSPLMTGTETQPLIAYPGGGQAFAMPLNEGVNEVSIVASAGDSCLLPPAQAGKVVYIINTGANACSVWGYGSDTINDVTSFSVPAVLGATAFVCQKSSTVTNPIGEWYTNSANTANALNSATTVVNVSSSPAPTVGQVLTALSGTAATWQTVPVVPAVTGYSNYFLTNNGSALSWNTTLNLGTATSGAGIGYSFTAQGGQGNGAGGGISLVGGASASISAIGVGGAINLTTGTGYQGIAGAYLSLAGGGAGGVTLACGGKASLGGALVLSSSGSSSSGGQAGNVNITAGSSSGLNSLGGSISLSAGNAGGGVSTGGSVVIAAGTGSTNGSVTIGSAGLTTTLAGNTTTTGYTVATLPASRPTGTFAYVTDALAPAYLVAVVGGGAVVTPVFFNGTTWVCH